MESKRAYPQPPDPAQFGTDLKQLGQAVLEHLRGVEAARVGVEWNSLPLEHRELVELWWRYLECRPAHIDTYHIFLVEAHRLAAKRSFKSAGQNYRKWFEMHCDAESGIDVDSSRSVKRKWASIRANHHKFGVIVDGKRVVLGDALETGARLENLVTIGEDVIRRAIRISAKRQRRSLSNRELARLISDETGLPFDTVRRVFKQDADTRALDKLRRS